MVSNVEFGVSHPRWCTNGCRRRLHTLSQPGNYARGAVHSLHEGFKVWPRIKHGDVGKRGGEKWVFLNAPHQRFRVAHPVIEARQVVLHTC